MQTERWARCPFMGLLVHVYHIISYSIIICKPWLRTVLFNKGSTKHVVGFCESFSFLRGNDFCFSKLMRHYEIF